MFVFLLLQLSMMGKTLPVTTNCTNGKKEKKNNKKKKQPSLSLTLFVLARDSH